MGLSSLSFALAIVWSDESPSLITHCIFVIFIICLRNWMSPVLLNYEKITIIFVPLTGKHLMVLLAHKCVKHLLTFIY